MENYIENAGRVLTQTLSDENLKKAWHEAFSAIQKCIREGKTIFVAGNGGSAADAQHFAAEITGRYQRERRGYPALALTTDSSVLTAIGNDYGFVKVFARQIEALAREGDVFVAISTSGNSENLVHAVSEAKKKGVVTIGLLGKDGGLLKEYVDIPVVVPEEKTSHIQETHLVLYHNWCEKLESDGGKMKEYVEYIDKFSEQTVGIIGDIMLDVYTYGAVDRISPEAPVPIIHVTNEECVLGGAANVARNIVSLGGKAVLAGVVGDGSSADKVFSLCEKNCIDSSLVLKDSSRVTTEKKRVVSNTQQILRVDNESREPLSKEISKVIKDKIVDFVTKVDIICVADYGKGVMTPGLIAYLTSTAGKMGKKIIADSKPRNMFLYQNVDLLTPNKLEVSLATANEDPAEGLREVYEKTNSPVLMTCGAEGMELITEDGVSRIDNRQVSVVDVSGAGDTVSATIALLRAQDVDYVNAAKISTNAASIVITKHKTSQVSQEELKNSFYDL